MTKGVITYYYNGHERFVDRIAKLAEKLRLFKCEGVYHISEDATNEIVGGFYCIKGRLPIVRFLEWVTQDRSKGAKKVVIKY